LLCSEAGTFPVVAGYWQFVQRNQEIKMRNFILAACCAALVGSISVASAQTASPAGQEATKANDPMNANAKTKKHKTKKSMTKSDTGMAKDGMKKDTK
jgi:pentapeptide MXKDX repeat protein